MVRIVLALAVAASSLGCHFGYQLVNPNRASDPAWRKVQSVAPPPVAAPTNVDPPAAPSASPGTAM